MGLKAFKIHGGKILAAMLALTAGSATMNAAMTITASVNVTCNTLTGPGTSASIVVKPGTALVGSATIAVTFTAPGNGLIVTPPATPTLTSSTNTTGITFTVNAAPGCSGAVGGPTTTPVQFFANTVSDSSSSVTNTVTVAGTSALVASGVTVICGKNAGNYTVGPAQTIYVTSGANQGTPFTVDTSGGNAPSANLVVTPLTGGTATATSVPFTVQAAAGCGALSLGSHPYTVKLADAPGPDLSITVNISVLAQSPLTANPVIPSLTYVKGSGIAGTQAVTFTAGTPAFFSVYTPSLPIWLTVNTVTGTTPSSVQFSSTSICDTLAPGTYTTTVYINVATYAPLPMTVTLLINNKAPKLSVQEGTTRNLTWTQGSPTPVYYITAVSTDSPIAYSIATGGALAPIVSPAQKAGLAYSYGTAIPINFNPVTFAAAVPGTVLTGTVTLTWGTPSSQTVVTFNITIQSPGATLTGISPASIPTASANATFNVILVGSGFVIGTDPTLRTKVGVVTTGSNIVTLDSNIAVNVANSNASNLAITITVPQGTDSNLPFAAGGPVTLGVCTPVNGTCTIATGTQILTIGSGPILQAVTSSSAYIQVTAPNIQSVAPYDMLSLFGANFCPICAPPIASVIYGAPDATLRYPTSVSPDPTVANPHLIKVAFQTTATPPVVTYAPVLFASNGQINVIVPGGVTPSTLMNIVVSYGYGTVAAGTLKVSALYPVNIVATDPGVFTIASDGQGEAAALASGTYALITSANPAGMRQTATDSDTIQLFVTGLGAPSAGADNASTGSLVWTGGADCISTGSYLTSLNGSFVPNTTLADVDGTIVQSSLINTGRFPPCIASNATNVPTVTVGGQPAVVTYAGFVADSVPGLYQVNFTLPTSTLLGGLKFTTSAGILVPTLTQPVQLPVVMTSNTLPSQGGVSLWVAPRLLVTPPSGTGLAGTVGQSWISVNSGGDSNLAVASEGTPPYTYAITSGVLPAGVTLDPTTGALAGIPAASAAGTYLATVTAKDLAALPITGAASFTLTVAGGLVVSGVAPITQTYGTPNATLITASAAGGVSPYTYTLALPASLPTGMTIAGGVVSITNTVKAGLYHSKIHAVDSTALTPLAGDLLYDVLINLNVTDNGLTPGTNGVASTITTVQAAGLSGTATYALDPVSLALGWITIDPSAGTVGITVGAPATTQPVTVTVTDSAPGTGSAAAATGSITFNVQVN